MLGSQGQQLARYVCNEHSNEHVADKRTLDWLSTYRFHVVSRKVQFVDLFRLLFTLMINSIFTILLMTQVSLFP